MDISINDKIDLAKKGNSDALSEILSLYKPLIESAVNSFLPSLSEAGLTDEDLRQDASIALVSAIQTYDPNKQVTFGAYAKTCIRNRMISLYRKQSRRVKQVSAPEAHDISANEFTDGFYANSMTAELTKLLTCYEQEVYALYMRAYKPREIAKMLSKDVKSVYNALCRIRQKAKNL